MKLFNLRIYSPEVYENWKGYRGTAHFVDGDGCEIKVALSQDSITAALSVVAAQVEDHATRIARALPNAMQDAVDGGLLLSNDGNVALADDSLPF